MRLLVVFMVFALVPLSAEAEESADIENPESLNELGIALVRSGNSARAVHAFRRAYDLDPRSKYAFNLAYAADRVGQCPTALAAYEAYLDLADAEELPRGPQREWAESRVDELSEECFPTKEFEPPDDPETIKPPGTAPPANPEPELAPTAPRLTRAAPTVATKRRSTEAIAISVDLGAMTRTLSFESTAAVASRPAGYHNQAVPSISAGLEVYPIANLGLDVSHERAVGLSTTVVLPDTEPFAVATKHSRTDVGLRYRVRAGEHSLATRIGYSASQFTLDKGDMAERIDVPNTSYRWVDIGLAAELGFDVVSIDATGRFLLPLETGEISTLGHYGKAQAVGFDGEVGVRFALTERWTVRLAGRLSELRLGFSGNGEKNDRDADSAIDTTAATDRYISASVGTVASF